MKNKRNPMHREKLEASLAMRLNETQWKTFENTDTFRAMVRGAAAYNTWLKECVETLRGFGVEIPDDLVPPKSQEIEWDPEEEALRSQIDQVRSILLARKALDDNVDVVGRFRGWAKDVGSHLEFVRVLDQMAFAEFRDGDAALDGELLWLRDYFDLASQEDAPEPLLDWPEFWQRLKGNARGVLQVFLPEENTTYHIAYYDESLPTAELHELVRRLSNTYLWEEQEAAAFLFFGHIPSYKAAIAQWWPHPSISSLGKIVMAIDPSLTPDEVRELYREERRKITKYPMRISHKHLFAAYVAFEAGAYLSWPERFQLHQARTAGMPKMGYTLAKTFRRDAEKAWRKLVEPAYGGSTEETSY